MSEIKNINVRLSDHNIQRIYIGDNLLPFAASTIQSKKYDRLLCYVDKSAFSTYRDQITFFLNEIKPDAVKYIISRHYPRELVSVHRIIRNFSKNGLSRKSGVILIGGGALADIMSFSCAVYMRGINFINIPTTLMSQCDTLIIKTAVNLDGKKNVIGSFYSPALTFCDLTFLQSLTPVQLCYGLVETWKHAIVKNDKKLYARVISVLTELSQKSEYNFRELVYRSLQIKSYFVRKDPYDLLGHHKSLSFGHTVANYLENMTSIHHGEAVLAGIVFETLLSKRFNRISSDRFKSIMTISDLFYLHLPFRSRLKQFTPQSFFKLLPFDKINSRGVYNFVIPTDSGYEIFKTTDLKSLSLVFNDLLNYLKVHAHISIQ